jgi:hypothetical protein
VVAVEGPEAFSYLQSLVSQDLDGMGDGDSVVSLLLQPQGKLTARFRLLRVDGERALLVTDEGFGPVLAEALNRFRIRVKAEVTDRSDTWAVLSVRGDAPAPASGTYALPAVGGVDVVGPADVIAQERARLVDAGASLGGTAAFERQRIEAGVPRLGVDIDDTTIPQEAFLERDAVSFTKGCFLGQELVCRIDTRGHVNKYLRRVDVTGAVPEPGAEVMVGDRAVGAITSVAPTSSGAVALAMVRREVEPPADVQVRWGDEQVAARVTDA